LRISEFGAETKEPNPAPHPIPLPSGLPARSRFGEGRGEGRVRGLDVKEINAFVLVQRVDSVVKYDYNYGHEKRRAT
jgi:hypothetical protein